MLASTSFACASVGCEEFARCFAALPLLPFRIQDVASLEVQRYAKKKIMDALCEVKGHGQLMAEKACWYPCKRCKAVRA